jgi:putative uncharacterized protein ORF28
MSSLYKLTTDYEAVLAMLYDGDMDEQTIMDTLDAIEGAIEDKADGYAVLINTLNNDAALIDTEIKRLQTRKRMLDSRVRRLKDNLAGAMRTLGKTKFSTQLYTFRLQKDGGKRALVLDCDPVDLPPELQKVTIAADNDALRQALSQEGLEANQYAHLAPQSESLRIV